MGTNFCKVDTRIINLFTEKKSEFNLKVEKMIVSPTTPSSALLNYK